MSDIQELIEKPASSESEQRQAEPAQEEPDLERLIQTLRDNHSDVRDTAVRQLTQIGEAAVDALIEALNSKHEHISKLANQCLVQIGLPAVQPLIETLKQTQNDEQFGWNIRRCLVKIGAPAVQPLIEALQNIQDDHEHVRKHILYSLATIGQPAVASLIQLIQNHADSTIRNKAAWALSNVKDPTAYNELVVASQSEHQYTRQAALKALNNIPNPPVQIAQPNNPPVQIAQPNISPDSAITKLIQNLRDHDPAARENAEKELIQIGEPAVKLLIQAFNDPDIRKAAARILVQIGQSAVSPVIEALEDGNEEVRRTAAWVLGELKALPAVEPLIQALADSEKVNKAAARALVQIGAPAVARLIEALQDYHPDLREIVARVLAKIGEAAVTPLIEAFQAHPPDVKKISAWILGEIKDLQAIPLLIQALRDSDSSVTDAASQALVIIAHPATPALIQALQDQDPGVRHTVARVLCQIKDPQAVEPLMAAFSDDDVRAAIELSLADIQEIPAFAPLIQKLNAQAISAEVKHLLATALGENTDGEDSAAQCLVNMGESAVEALTEILQDLQSADRWLVAWILGQIQYKRALEAVKDALQAKDSEVSATAIETLTHLGEPTLATLIQTFTGDTSA